MVLLLVMRICCHNYNHPSLIPANYVSLPVRSFIHYSVALKDVRPFPGLIDDDIRPLPVKY